MKRPALLAAASLLLLTGAELGAQEGYVVVVNDANATESMTRAEVAKLFLRKIAKWDNGSKVLPVDQPPSSSVRGSFSMEVHGRSVSAVKSYWQKMIFSGKSAPPLELEGDSSILDYVRENPGAIGYVSAGSVAGEGVKVLRVTNG